MLISLFQIVDISYLFYNFKIIDIVKSICMLILVIRINDLSN